MIDKEIGAVSDSTGGDQAPVSDQTPEASGQGAEAKIVQRLLAEKKKEQERRKELEAKLTVVETERLEAEGKKDELIKALKTQVAETAKKLNSATATYAQRLVEAQVSQKAKEFGCIDTELLTKALDINSLEVSEDFTIDSSSLEAQLNDIRKTKPYLFKNDAPKFRDGAPASKGATGQKPDFSKMSLAEIKAYAVEHGVS
jgi:small-conductance mechanosensitive channel